MGRRRQVLKTYGRHRQRVVTEAEQWRSTKHCSVFSVSGSSDHIFSSSGSVSKSLVESSADELWISQSKNGKGNQTTKQKPPKRISKARKDSSGSEECFVRKERTCKRKALKEIKNGFLVENSADIGKRVTRRRASQATGASKPVERRKQKQNEEREVSVEGKETVTSRLKGSINFSEFEDYSLILSDSVVLDNNISGDVQNELKRAHSTPASQGRHRKKARNSMSIDTSTPFCVKSKPGVSLERLKDSNISYIEGIVDLSELEAMLETDKSDSRGHIDEGGIHRNLSLCSASLEQLCQSQSASNASSSQRLLRSGRLSGLQIPTPNGTGTCTRRSQVDPCENHLDIQGCSVSLTPLRQSLLLLQYMNSSQLGDKQTKGHQALAAAVSSFNNSDSLFGEDGSLIGPCRTTVTDRLRDAHYPENVDSVVIIDDEDGDSSSSSHVSDDNDNDPDYFYSDDESDEATELIDLVDILREMSVNKGLARGDELQLNHAETSIAIADTTEEDDTENDDDDVEEDGDEVDGISLDRSAACKDSGDNAQADGCNEKLDFSNSCYSLTEFGTNHDWETYLSEQLTNTSLESEEGDPSAYSTASSEIRKQSLEEADPTASFYTPESVSSSRKRLSSHKQSMELQKSFSEMLTPQKSQRRKSLCPRSKVLVQCDQAEVLPFSSCFTPSVLEKCVKIGEGVYGEVFRAFTPAPVAFKVIPIEGDFTVNDEAQKTFEEILPEIVISRELSALRDGISNKTDNFVTVQSVSCVHGQYPDKLVQLWDEYDEKKQSENERPDMFDKSQMFIVFEFGDGGCDLESFKFKTILEVKSVIQQVAFSLAVAEVELEFEHRDLHWGNILVRKTTEKSVEYCIQDNEHEVPSHGVHITIIDFTLSRLRKEGCTVFCDLSKDETLFDGKGDYQFDIYRLMQKNNGNCWEPYSPHTNVLWLHYLVDKLTGKSVCPVRSKAHQEVQRQLRQFKKTLLNYQSAYDVIAHSEFFPSGCQ